MLVCPKSLALRPFRLPVRLFIIGRHLSIQEILPNVRGVGVLALTVGLTAVKAPLTTHTSGVFWLFRGTATADATDIPLKNALGRGHFLEIKTERRRSAQYSAARVLPPEPELPAEEQLRAG